MSSKVFPIILIVLDIGAGVVCGINKDFKTMLYWFFAAGLNCCVTF